MLLVSLLGALGLWLRSAAPSGDVHMLFHKAPWYVWSGTLVGIAVVRWYGLWMSKDHHGVCENTRVGMATSIVAMFIWSMLLASAAVATDFGLALMMVVCILCEFWLLTRVFAERKHR